MKTDKKTTTAEPRRIRLQAPVGALVLETNGEAVSVIRLANDRDLAVPDSAPEGSVLNLAAREMAEYFAGERTEFTFAMRPAGTAFQQQVWRALLTIPYGETRSYGEIAKQIGNPNGARAVGGACNANPIWIAVPCHRVIGAHGALTGYALGTGMKQTLLTLERKHRSK